MSIALKKNALKKNAELELTMLSKARICLVPGLTVSLSPKPQNADNELVLKGSTSCV